MTSTVTRVKGLSVGNLQGALIELNVTSYSTGGEAVDGPTLTIGFDPDAILMPLGITAVPYTADWDKANKKIRFYRPGRVGGRTYDPFTALKGAVAASANTDQAAASTNGAFVMASTPGNDATLTGAGVTAGLTNPDKARNVVVNVIADGTGASLTACNIVVTGTDQFGNAQTETIVIDISTPAVAANKFRFQVGSKTFATVTNVLLSAAQNSHLSFSLGLGTAIGLRGKIGATGDVKDVARITSAGAVTAPSNTPSVANSNVLINVNLSDNDSIDIRYEEFPDQKSTEIAAAEAVGKVRFLALAAAG